MICRTNIAIRLLKNATNFFSALITYGLDDGDFPKDYNPMKTVELPSEDSVAVKTKKD